MLLAHQGGWDEILLVLVPVVVIFSLLRLAKHRAQQARSDQPGAAPGRAKDDG